MVTGKGKFIVKESGTVRLLYAGLDFIKTQSGWMFLEANDHPVMLSLADDLAKSAKGASSFSGRGMEMLAVSIAARKKPGLVGLLLPDFFEIHTPTFSARQVEVGAHGFDDGRIAATIDEFNSLGTKLGQLGVNSWIIDSRAIEERSSTIYHLTAGELGALFRRSSTLPKEPTLTPCFNDRTLRDICLDKFATYSILAERLPQLTQPATELIRSSDSVAAWFEKKGDDYAIIKPRFGSSSRDVVRIKYDEAENVVWKDREYVIQSWHEPTMVSHDDSSYFFDVRIYVVDGTAVGGFARRAAAPNEGRFANSPLCWLTTTGQSAALCHSASDNSVLLSNKDFDCLCQMSSEVVQALDSTTDGIGQPNKSLNMPNYQLLTQRKGDIEKVSLFEKP